MSSTSIYNQYVWLVDTIRSAGRITKRDLDARWAKAPLNTLKEKEYPIRKFHRHRLAIIKLFGVYIICDKTDGNYFYYISENDDLRSSEVRQQLCNQLAMTNALIDSPELLSRVHFDAPSDGRLHLATVLDAMRSKRVVQLIFQPELMRFPVCVVPYCLAEHGHVWHLAAKQVDAGLMTEVQVFPLTEVQQVVALKTKASMPRWFDGDIFFNGYFERLEQPAKKEKVKKEADRPKAKPKKVQKPALSASEPAQLSLF